MTAVHQLLPAAAPHDAITGQAFAWRDLLREWGHDGELVAEHLHPNLEGGDVRRLDRRTKRMLERDGFLLRYALWSATIGVAARAAGPVALCYHNVTPGELLREYNPALADLCDRGREALGSLRGRLAAIVADSTFNAGELRERGLGEAVVIPLLLDLPRAVPRRPPNRDPIVVTVGRIVPNKRLEDVLKVFTLYQRQHAPEASLVVVGSELGFERYRGALDVLIARMGTRRVFFTGAIPAAARDAWYRRADAYLSMSVHEGFCAPLLEALAHGAPVVARATAAVPETLGGAGIVLDGEDLPVFAEALHEAISSAPTRQAIFDAADRRFAELQRDVLAPRIRDALAPLLASR